MNISVDRDLSDTFRPPRTAYYKGEFGSVADAELARVSASRSG